MSYRKEYVKQFTEKALQLGFRVYLAANEEYGFMTDESGARCLSFQYGLCGAIAISGNYKPSQGTGTGWRIGEIEAENLTFYKLQNYLYASAPHWANPSPKYTTEKEYLDRYLSSSKYKELK